MLNFHGDAKNMLSRAHRGAKTVLGPKGNLYAAMLVAGMATVAVLDRIPAFNGQAAALREVTNAHTSPVTPAQEIAAIRPSGIRLAVVSTAPSGPVGAGA